MANFTKKAIQASFLKLLAERPLSQITVKDIVSDCGINRNTFYYYFEDIPQLLEDIVEQDAQTLIRTYPTIERLEDCLGAVIDTALSKKRAVLHIYHSVNRDIYEMYLWSVCDYVINTYMTTALKGRKIKEDDLVLTKKYLSSLAFGIISNWLRNDMTDDIRGDFARLCEIKRGTVEQMISRCEEE